MAPNDLLGRSWRESQKEEGCCLKTGSLVSSSFRRETELANADDPDANSLLEDGKEHRINPCCKKDRVSKTGERSSLSTHKRSVKSRCCPDPQHRNANVEKKRSASCTHPLLNATERDIIKRCCCARGIQCCTRPSWCCDYVLTWLSHGHPLSDLTELEPSNTKLHVQTLAFNVEGMTCSSCEASLKKALEGVAGVDQVSVSVVLGRAVVEGPTKANEIIKIASRRTGFKLTLVEHQPMLFLRFNKSPTDYPPNTIVTSHGRIVKFTYNPERTSAREIFDFYSTDESTPVVVDQFQLKTPWWNTLSCRVSVSILFAIPVLVLAYIPQRPLLYGGVQLALVTGIMCYVMSPLYRRALISLLRRREIEMDLLIVASTLLAYIFSVISYAFVCIDRPIWEPFWETPALLVTLIIFGRWITGRARDKAVQQVKTLSNTNVKMATLLNGRKVDIALLALDDIIIVQPGETVPTDGIIERGVTEVNEAMFTGESTPKVKLHGSTVFAGSVNLSSRVNVRVTKLSSENALAGIRQLIDVSQVNRPRIQAYTDRVAGYLGPVALVAAASSFLVWFCVEWRARGQSISRAAIEGLTYAIAVLAISCPCTIGLAVPMNVVIASGVAAARGILIKDMNALEIMHRARSVVFDKTGTLTQGEPKVVEEINYIQDARGYVRRLVAKAPHPIAKAVSRNLGDADPYVGIRTIVGKGLEVNTEEGLLRGGSFAWLGIQNPFKSLPMSTFCVTLDNQLIAAYSLSDELRAESIDVVNALQANHIEVYLVSGDNSASVHRIAKRLGIPEARVKSDFLPSNKAQFVQTLQYKTHSPVLFCGDGINDAPAISQADVGISFVSASEITSSAAMVLFLSSDLRSLPMLFRLSRRVYRRILINFVWAGIYNLFAISLAAGVFVIWRIEPQWAGIGEIVSVLPVVLVGWSLKLNVKEW